jgi:hypothetical protein
MDGLVAREQEQAFLNVLVAHGLRSCRKRSYSTREDGYTETWDYTSLPVDSLKEATTASADVDGPAE